VLGGGSVEKPGVRGHMSVRETDGFGLVGVVSRRDLSGNQLSYLHPDIFLEMRSIRRM